MDPFDDWLCEVLWPAFQTTPYSYPSAMSRLVAYCLEIGNTLRRCEVQYLLLTNPSALLSSTGCSASRNEPCSRSISVRTTSSSITTGPLSRLAPATPASQQDSAPCQPRHYRQDDTHNQHGRDRKHELESRAVDDDIAREVEQGYPLEPRPADAGDDEYDSECDE